MWLLQKKEIIFMKREKSMNKVLSFGDMWLKIAQHKNKRLQKHSQNHTTKRHKGARDIAQCTWCFVARTQMMPALSECRCSGMEVQSQDSSLPRFPVLGMQKGETVAACWPGILYSVQWVSFRQGQRFNVKNKVEKLLWKICNINFCTPPHTPSTYTWQRNIIRSSGPFCATNGHIIFTNDTEIKILGK